jgi:aryl-alcohol dehydrogenase-like predicted oxidoreductase
VTAAIAGVRTEQQVAGISGADALKLSDQEVAEIEEALKLEDAMAGTSR